MVRIAFIFALLFPVLSTAQTIVTQGTPNTLVMNKGALQIDSCLKLSPGDTVAWHGIKPDFKRKASNGKLYWFDGQNYREFGPGSSGEGYDTTYLYSIIDSLINIGDSTVYFVTPSQMMDSIGNITGSAIVPGEGLYKDGDTMKLGLAPDGRGVINGMLSFYAEDPLDTSNFTNYAQQPGGAAIQTEASSGQGALYRQVPGQMTMEAYSMSPYLNTAILALITDTILGKVTILSNNITNPVGSSSSSVRLDSAQITISTKGAGIAQTDLILSPGAAFYKNNAAQPINYFFRSTRANFSDSSLIDKEYMTDYVDSAVGSVAGGGQNLGLGTVTATTQPVTISGGTGITLPSATTSSAGLLSGTDKTKLDGMATGAEVNVNADWNATTGDAVILNKPSLPAVNNGVLALSASNGLTGAATFTANQSTNSSFTVSPTYGTAANTVAQGNDGRFHNAVTLGTANGLSLSNQVLSLGLASSSTTGALSPTDWNTFNNKLGSVPTLQQVLAAGSTATIGGRVKSWWLGDLSGQGVGGLGTIDPLIVTSRTVSGSNPDNSHEFVDASTINKTVNGTAHNSFTTYGAYTGSASYDHYVGFQNAQNCLTTGTITSWYGFADITNKRSGTILNKYGFYTSDENISGGSITNSYGLFVDTLSGVNKYGVYVKKDNSFFGGNITTPLAFIAENNLGGTIYRQYMDVDEDNQWGTVGLINQSANSFVSRMVLYLNGNFGFTKGVSSTNLLSGGILASNDFVDSSLIPINGIYSKGTVKLGYVTSSMLKADGSGNITAATAGTDYVSSENDPLYTADDNKIWKYRGNIALSGTDLNTFTGIGYYDQGGGSPTGANYPISQAGFLHSYPYRGSVFAGGEQEYSTGGFANGGQNRKFFRTYWSGVFNPWREYAFQDWVVGQHYLTSAVTSITPGNGMSNNAPITGTGSITLGTPGNITLSSVNGVTANGHTHAFAPGGTTSQYISGAGTLITFPAIPGTNLSSSVLGNAVTITSSTGSPTTFTVPNVQLSNFVLTGTIVQVNQSAYYTYTGGGSATWTLLPVGGNTGMKFYIINQSAGGGVITLNTATSTNDIADGPAHVNTFKINPGETYMFYNNSLFYCIIP